MALKLIQKWKQQFKDLNKKKSRENNLLDIPNAYATMQFLDFKELYILATILLKQYNLNPPLSHTIESILNLHRNFNCIIAISYDLKFYVINPFSSLE